jgi:hypothetical protein
VNVTRMSLVVCRDFFVYVLRFTGSLSSGEVLCCAVLCCVNGCNVPVEAAVEAFEPGTIVAKGATRKT